ncbi:hypothetical protein ACHAPO_001209 [Fusarium lateritium]
MTGFQIISLDLKPFTVSDGQQFYDAILDSPERALWRELYSVRIRGTNVLGACIMGRTNYRAIKFVDIDDWISSSSCEKLGGKNARKIARVLRQGSCVESLSNLGRISCGKLDWVILREADDDRSNEFNEFTDVPKIKIEFDNVRKGMERINITRLAFHFDYRRFTPRLIRRDLNKDTSTGPLSTLRIKQWYTKWIEYVMKETYLEEVWVFAHSSLAYVGTLDGDEKVTVRRREIGDEPKQGFPWALHEG